MGEQDESRHQFLQRPVHKVALLLPAEQAQEPVFGVTCQVRHFGQPLVQGNSAARVRNKATLQQVASQVCSLSIQAPIYLFIHFKKFMHAQERHFSAFQHIHPLVLCAGITALAALKSRTFVILLRPVAWVLQLCLRKVRSILCMLISSPSHTCRPVVTLHQK